MAMTWEQTELAFPILRDRAVREQTCFCKCGCRAPETPPVNRFGHIEPGVCDTCRKSRRWQMHERAVSAAYIYRDPDEDVPAEKAMPRPVTAEERTAAVAYVRGYGEGGTALVERLSKRLDNGETLTDAQVRSALRSEAADARYARRVVRRVERRGRVRVSIPLSVAPDFYAVSDGSTGWVIIKLERPARGPMRGGFIVSASADANVTEVGVQRPATRLESMLHIGPTYQGKMSHAVAALVANPAKARADYRMVTGGTDD